MDSAKNLEALWNPLDAQASESSFRELLPSAEKLEGRDKDQLISILCWLARAQGQQSKYSEAQATLSRAEALLQEQEALFPVAAKIRWLIEKGRLHIQQRTPSQAKLLFSEAWTLATESGEDFYSVEIAMLMAESEPQKSQQEWIERAIRIAEKSSVERTRNWLGSLRMALGWKLYDLRRFEDSYQTFQRAYTELKAHGTAREQFIARWSMGKVLRALGRTEAALEVQQALLAELDSGRDGRLYEELAECLHTLKRTTEAQVYFEQAYRELSNDEWIGDNQPVMLKRMKDLGKVKN